MDTIKIRAGLCKMVAHRGRERSGKGKHHGRVCGGGQPRYYGIETDIHRTLDGHYVAIHDADTGPRRPGRS